MTEQGGTTEQAQNGKGQAASGISTGAVQLMQRYTGRGPTKARTMISDDCVTILMADTLTKAERTLVDHGYAQTVLSTRRQFQEAMRNDLITLVESKTWRKVTAFLSDNHIDPDYGVEVFVLEPEADAR